MKRRGKPEVLAPAGNLRGLKTAVDYGADGNEVPMVNLSLIHI